jgi:hypothetical protein
MGDSMDRTHGLFGVRLLILDLFAEAVSTSVAILSFATFDHKLGGREAR